MEITAMLLKPQQESLGSPSLLSDRATIRYGIIGAGMMGREHMRNIALLDGAIVTAISDPDETSRRLAAGPEGDRVRVFNDHRELLAAGLCDALVIASPNHTHIDILRDVLLTDLPLLVEKPLCATVADCREALRLAAGRHAPVWVAMEYRYMPPVERLLRELEAGTAGRLRMIAIREHRYPFLNKVQNWNRFSAKTGGTLVEKCCHFFDLMRLMAKSEPVRVYASGGMDVNFLEEVYAEGRPDMLDNAFVIVDFANGIRAMLDLCMFAEGSHWQEIVTATGDAAQVEAFVPGPARFSANGRERPSEVVIAPRATKMPRREEIIVDHAILAAGDHHGSTYFQHRRFLDLIRHGGEPEVTLEDGMKAVMIGAAAEESVKTGLPVLL
jgi:predicted dehydrogenase